MGIISYAQNREDVLLSRVFPGPVGFYIDIGAADPVSHSVTKWFYDHGWSGVNVEPLDGFFQMVKADRPRDVNLNVACGAAAGEMTLYEVPSCIGWATIDEGSAEKIVAGGHDVAPRKVHVLTLAEICERYVRGPIDFLKIDVEGAERDVLAGADFTRWRPRVLVVEATEIGKPIPNHAAWEPLVLAADYVFATTDRLNRYYVRAEDRALIALLEPPVSVFDEYTPFEQVRAERAAEAARAEATACAAELAARTAELESRVAELAAVRRDAEHAHRRVGELDEHAHNIYSELQSAHKRLAELEGVQVRVVEALSEREIMRHRLEAQAAAHQAKLVELAAAHQEKVADLGVAHQARVAELEALAADRLARLDSARARLVGLEGAEVRAAEAAANADRLRKALAELKARTVAKPAYDTALRLLDETRAHLDILRSEVLGTRAG